MSSYLLYQRLHPIGDGAQKIYRFPHNNYGASVVQSQHSYGGNEGLWELVVLKFNDERLEDPKRWWWEIDYSTPITNDVEGWLTTEDVERLLLQIESLDRENAEVIQ